VEKPLVAQLFRFRVPAWSRSCEAVFNGAGTWIVKVSGKLCYLWRAVDHEGEVEAVVTAKRDKTAALKLLKHFMKNTARPEGSSPMGFERIPRR
jgi:DDE domain